MGEQQQLVIVVDDDQAVREALQFALRLEGLRVNAHSAAADVLADPDLDKAGCVIVDHRMPRMDGFALLNNLREQKPDLPAIILTSHATARVRAKADAAGVSKVLEKPLMDNTLVENIRTLLGNG